MFAWVVPENLDKANDEMLPLSDELAQMKDVWDAVEVPIWVIQGTIDDLVDRKHLDYSKKLFSDKNAKFIATPKKRFLNFCSFFLMERNE